MLALFALQCLICTKYKAYADFPGCQYQNQSLNIWFKLALCFSEMHIKDLDFLLHLGFVLYLLSVEERNRIWFFFRVLLINDAVISMSTWWHHKPSQYNCLLSYLYFICQKLITGTKVVHHFVHIGQPSPVSVNNLKITFQAGRIQFCGLVAWLLTYSSLLALKTLTCLVTLVNVFVTRVMCPFSESSNAYV